MKNTKILIYETPIHEYFLSIKKYYNMSARQMEEFFLNQTIKSHPYERLVYNRNCVDYISPRGIDYVQEVILPYHYEMSINGKEKCIKEKRKYFKTLEIQWTNKWILKLSNGEKNIDSFIPKKDIRTIDLYKELDMKSSYFLKQRKVYPEINEIIYQKNRTYYIKKEYTKKLYEEYLTKFFLQAISKWIYKKIRNVNEETFEITKKLFPEMELQKYKINKIKSDKVNRIKNKPPLFDIDKTFSNMISIGDLILIREELAERHPHEKMIYKMWNTEKSKAGEIYFTLHGADWFTRIYYNKKIQKEKSKFGTHLDFDEIEIQWMEQLLAKENVPLDEELNNPYYKMIFIYQLKTKEHMEKIFSRLGNMKPLEQLKKEDYLLMESKLKSLKLKRYSYLFSKTKSYKDSIIQYLNPVQKKQENHEWCEVDKSKSGWYYGKIINKPYYHGKGKCEVLVVNVQLDNGKKIKVRIPSVLYRKTKIQLLYVAHMSIRFFIEDINVEGEPHHRVKQIILGKQIGFIPNWDESPMYYVPIPCVGKPRIEDIDTKYLKDEYKKKEEEKKYAIK